MKRVFIIGLILLMLLATTGCKDSGEEATVSDNTVTVPADTTEGLQELLDRVAMIPAATMGVSFQASQLAVQIMEWCDATAMTAEEIKDQALAFVQPMEVEALDMYAMQAETVRGFVAQFEDADVRATILADIGLEDTYEWSEVTFEKANAVLTWETVS